MSYTYAYPRPMVSADVVLFSPQDDGIFVLLVERLRDPFAGYWALPGGFVEENEDPAEAAARELEEETSIKNIHLEQLYAFGKPGRDPRGHCITIVYWGKTNHQQIIARAGDDAKNLKWFNIKALPQLAFDHDQIIEMAIKKAG